jgi:hypothetical protein
MISANTLCRLPVFSLFKSVLKGYTGISGPKFLFDIIHHIIHSLCYNNWFNRRHRRPLLLLPRVASLPVAVYPFADLLTIDNRLNAFLFYLSPFTSHTNFCANKRSPLQTRKTNNMFDRIE